MPMKIRFFTFVLLLAGFGSGGCDQSKVPLDAESRRMVDSLSAAYIGNERRAIDSFCKAQNTTVLPQIIDSIKQVRKKQIEEQLKAIPK